MAKNWFECKIRYEKITENGLSKKVTGKYLVDALSFTEAEARIIEEMMPFISGEFTVSDIKRANYSELFFCKKVEGGYWFKSKLIFITLDERTGAEKKTAINVLVQAETIRDAIKEIDEGMHGTMSDYVIYSVSETIIEDVFPYELETTNQDEKIRNGASSPVVSNFLTSLPEGCKTEITINGKKVVIDKTEKGTKVLPV